MKGLAQKSYFINQWLFVIIERLNTISGPIPEHNWSLYDFRVLKVHFYKDLRWFWKRESIWSCLEGHLHREGRAVKKGGPQTLDEIERAAAFLFVQFSRSVMSDSATPWIAACQASLSITNSRSSLRLASIESIMPSSHLILGCPLFLLPSTPPSISLFQWVNSSYEVDKVLEFQL